jgi:GTPase Era involved in 16S rRNA processing
MSTMENIKFAIIGCVSAGKSTLWNAISSDTFSDMKRKKTTMLPQIYQTTTNKKLVDDIKTIYEKNKKIDES